jgi:pimeloyl-ACP methyl ester carboxylesterase
MGGAILETLAFKFPGLVLSAVIENSFTQIDIRFALFAEARQELMQASAPAASLIKSVIPWCFSSKLLNQPGFVDSFMELALANPFPTTLLGHKHQLNALVKFDSSSWINKIKVPCLVIGSDQDMIMSEAHMQQMAKHIPQAKYYGFKECGHLPHIEQTETFNRIVLDFIMTHDKKRDKQLFVMQ